MLPGKDQWAAICRTLLETQSLVFQNARLFVFANVNICKSRCWAPADWGPPEGLEEALFTCSKECCPAWTLLYLSGTQGHSAGRDGPLCPSPKFPPHSINNKTQCGRRERRKWNSCSCCYSVQKRRFNGPLLPLISLGEAWDHFCDFDWKNIINVTRDKKYQFPLAFLYILAINSHFYLSLHTFI